MEAKFIRNYLKLSMVNMDVIKSLVTEKTSKNTITYALLYASDNNHIQAVKYFIELGAALNIILESALCLACWNGHFEIIKCLIQNGADIHENNEKPLRRAVYNNHLKVVKYLVDIAKCDMRVNSDEFFNYAIKNNNVDMCVYFIRKGCRLYKYHCDIAARILQNCWRHRKTRKLFDIVWKYSLQIYMHPDMKGAFFAQKNFYKYYTIIE